MYRVVQDLTVKVQGVIKTFPTGSVINLPEKSAQMFIQQGKLIPVEEEPQKPTTRQYEPTERDFELDRYINKPSPNPRGTKCFVCSDLGQRYGLAKDRTNRWYFGWVCLKCKPERN